MTPSDPNAATRIPRLDAFVIAHRSWEMFFMRAGLAALLWFGTVWVLKPANQGVPPNPEGLAQLPSVAVFTQPAVGTTMMWMSLPFLILFALGRAPALTLLPALFGNLMLESIRNSQGAINHSGQLLSMTALAVWLVYLLAALRPQTGTDKWRALWNPAIDRHQIAMHWAKIVIAASYVVSAMQKWLDSDFQWIWRTPWLAVQMIKNQHVDYFSKLQEPTGWINTNLPQLLIEHPHLTRVVFGSGLLLETLAFLALISRRWSFGYGLALIALHQSISLTMNLHFKLHIWLIGVFLVNLPGVVFLFSRKERQQSNPERDLWRNA